MIPVEPFHLRIFHDFTTGFFIPFPLPSHDPSGFADPNFGVLCARKESMIPVDPVHLRIFHDFRTGILSYCPPPISSVTLPSVIPMALLLG